MKIQEDGIINIAATKIRGQAYMSVEETIMVLEMWKLESKSHKPSKGMKSLDEGTIDWIIKSFRSLELVRD